MIEVEFVRRVVAVVWLLVWLLVGCGLTGGFLFSLWLAARVVGWVLG